MFFSTHPATTETYTLSLHDALPISLRPRRISGARQSPGRTRPPARPPARGLPPRSRTLRRGRTRRRDDGRGPRRSGRERAARPDLLRKAPIPRRHPFITRRARASFFSGGEEDGARLRIYPRRRTKQHEESTRTFVPLSCEFV